jgi:hypothetical protein
VFYDIPALAGNQFAFSEIKTRHYCNPACAGMTSGIRDALVRKFLEHRIDAAVPLGAEKFELAVGRGLVGFGEFDQRLQEHGFIRAVAVEPRPT